MKPSRRMSVCIVYNCISAQLSFLDRCFGKLHNINSGENEIYIYISVRCWQGEVTLCCPTRWVARSFLYYKLNVATIKQ